MSSDLDLGVPDCLTGKKRRLHWFRLRLDRIALWPRTSGKQLLMGAS
jgi:hypothetical protein